MGEEVLNKLLTSSSDIRPDPQEAVDILNLGLEVIMGWRRANKL